MLVLLAKCQKENRVRRLKNEIVGFYTGLSIWIDRNVRSQGGVGVYLEFIIKNILNRNICLYILNSGSCSHFTRW